MIKTLKYIAILSLFLFGATQAADNQNITAKDFLSNRPYTKLKIEITAVQSCSLSNEGIKFLQEKILHYCHKDSVEVIIQPEIAVTSSIDTTGIPLISRQWSPTSLRSFLTKHAKEYPHDNTLVLHILCIDGLYINEIENIGIQFRPDAFVVFTPRIKPKWEKAILLHEMGHILEICNTDRDHPYNCTNPKCVMYYRLQEEVAEEFDLDCQKQLVINGGRNWW